MYAWLSEALDESGSVITANRRLARILKTAYAEQQQLAGKKAWRSPYISAWSDWLLDCSHRALQQELLPARINAQQSQWLWEQCWRQEIGDRDVGMGQLVRLSRDTWQRLSDWQVSIAEIVRSAQNDDQRIFAAVASRYRSLLQRESWVDDAGMAPLLLELIATERIGFHGRHTFVGFDRQRPVAVEIQGEMRNAGVATRYMPHSGANQSAELQRFDNDTAELRAAGDWARSLLREQPGARVAIVVDGLDNDADRIARTVRDGFSPGWQHGHRSIVDALNISYGRRLAEFPAVFVAHTVLNWLSRDLASTDVCLLLRTPLLGTADVAGRSRLDLWLRQIPDRAWSPSMVTEELRGRDECAGANDWLARMAELSKRRREVPMSASPADWAIFFDVTLSQMGWPGQKSLDSEEFQLINRWRELLNEFARLTLVSPAMTLAEAINRLESMAAETIFQPESSQALLQLMGPLEAAGSEFDALWIAGLSSANWPPAASPSTLISRRLQERFGMPDSTPDDTLRYSERILQRLIGAAGIVRCSYAQNVDDTEQTVSDLLDQYSISENSTAMDPGWYANRLLDLAGTGAIDDRVPPVAAGEILPGGASVIQRQMNEPISAFILNRLGARKIIPQAFGIPAPMRGNLLHDALHHLYRELPSSAQIRGWVGEELGARIDAALDSAFARYTKNADKVLRQLLLLERARLAQLLRQFVAIDGVRDDFQVRSVEGEFEFDAGHIRLHLRFDRLDLFDDGSCAIYDYKSGARKRLLSKDGEVQEVQLFVYASATEARVAALALINVDSREIVLDGAGRGFTDEAEWPELLQRIKEEIAMACQELAAGDVRIKCAQSVQDARTLNPLSRYMELRRVLR